MTVPVSHRQRSSRASLRPLASCISIVLVLAAAMVFIAPPASAADLSAALAIQQAELTSGDVPSGDELGVAVAIDGDTALVGASSSVSAPGAAYIFTRSGGVWSQQAELTRSGAAAGESYGYAVALDGDTALVGDGTYGSGQGAAYVFTRSGGVWSQQAVLTTAGYGMLGGAVALDGDTAVVGAVGADYGGGAAYVFTRSGGVWSQQASLTAFGTQSRTEFGDSVSIDGDTVLVGGPGQYPGGAVWVFTRSGDAWSLQAELTDPGSSSNDNFGHAVSLDGDTALVGADCSDSSSGAAYVFTRSGDTWTQQGGALVAVGAGSSAFFGISVALDGDTALLGADGYVDFQGACFVFTRSGDTWTQQQKLTASDGAQFDSFGYAVAFDGETALIGSPGQYPGGAAYCFAPGPTVAPATGTVSGWSNHAVTLGFTTASASRAAVGDRTQYRLGGGAWRVAAKVRIAREGVTRVQYRAVDADGNVGIARVLRVRIDRRRPHIIARSASVRRGRVVRLRYKVLDHRPGSGYALVRLVIADRSGHILTRASTRPATTNRWHTVRIKTRSFAPGTYRVALRAVDRAGNFQRGLTAVRLTVR